MKTGVFNYLELDRVHFGTPVADALRTEATQRGAQRIFVVTSKSLNRKTDAVRGALAQIQPQLVGQFDDCVEHTPRDSVLALADALRAAKADLIISIGGGTVIDTVKVALVALAENLTRIEQLDDWHMRVAADGSRVVPQSRQPPCRQIAVPTTLSGAEFSDLGGCTDSRFGTKQGYTGAFIGAAAVILDPRITVHTPAQLWLSTGVRAIDHAVEALCSVNAQPLIDATSVRALALLGRSLKRYVQAPDDLDARLDGQLGAWLAATSIRRTEYGASHGRGGCRAWGRARVESKNGLRLGAKHSHAWRHGAHSQRRISPFLDSTRRAGAIFGAIRRCRLVVGENPRPRRRLGWHRNSPRRGPEPKPDSLLAGRSHPPDVA